MPLRLRSAGGGSVLLKPPVAQAADVSMEVPAYDGAKLLTNKTPGVVLQVVKADSTGMVTTTSTSFVDLTGLSATITVAAGSRVLLKGMSGVYSGGGTWPGGRLAITDAANNVFTYGEHMSTVTNEAQCFQHTLHDVTGALAAGTYTFKLRCCSTVGASALWNRSTEMGRLILMEIAG